MISIPHYNNSYATGLPSDQQTEKRQYPEVFMEFDAKL